MDVEMLTDEESALLEKTLIETHEMLPQNSPTLLVDTITSRFSSATWYDKIQKTPVMLAGLGGIGSYVAFLLSRLKVECIAAYDDDFIESHNMSGQLYRIEDVGRAKASALYEIIRSFSNYYDFIGQSTLYTESSPVYKVMICGFDNMEARKLYFRKWKAFVNSFNTEEVKSECLFIDGRLAAEEFQVFCMKGNDAFLMKKYEEEWLFSDSQAEQTECSYKQTSFCANMIASVMVNLFVNFVANQCNPIIERELPFFTYYNAERMMLKTK